MLFKIEKIERGAWPDGKPKIKATVTDLTGKTSENVTISKTKQDGTEFPNFDTLAVGQQIEAEEYVNPKGYMSLYPPRKASGGANKGNSGAMGAKMMEKKAEHIAHAQENKELGIRLSSTARMATDMVVALMKPDTTPAQAKVAWEQWRKWFIDQWENIGAVNVTSAGTPVPDFSGDSIRAEDIPF